MKKKEENVIKKFIYKHKKLFKYLLLFFRIAFIILIGMKYGIIGQDSHGAINHSDNLYYSWEFDTSGAIKGISIEPLLVILFISTYYAMYNYFTGINNFTLTRAKNIKERDKMKFRYISNAIGNDLSILAIGLIAGIIENGFMVLNLLVFINTLIKVVIIYIIYLCIPIYLANSSKQYFTYCAMGLLLSIMMNNIKEDSSSTFYLATVIIFVLTLIYKKYKNKKDEY